MFSIFENLISVEVGGTNVNFNISKPSITEPSNVSSTSSKALVTLIIGFYMLVAHNPSAVEDKITSLTPDLKNLQYGMPEGHVTVRKMSALTDPNWIQIRQLFKGKKESEINWDDAQLKILNLLNGTTSVESDGDQSNFGELVDQIGDNVLFNKGASGLSDEIAFHFNDLLTSVMEDKLFVKELIAAGSAWIQQLGA